MRQMCPGTNLASTKPRSWPSTVPKAFMITSMPVFIGKDIHNGKNKKLNPNKSFKQTFHSLHSHFLEKSFQNPIHNLSLKFHLKFHPIHSTNPIQPPPSIHRCRVETSEAAKSRHSAAYDLAAMASEPCSAGCKARSMAASGALECWSTLAASLFGLIGWRWWCLERGTLIKLYNCLVGFYIEVGKKQNKKII